MNWRPDDWENRKVMRSWGKLTLEGEYEAGADAMLEALKKEAYQCIPNDQGYLLTKWHHPEDASEGSKEMMIKVYPERRGWVVFLEADREV